MKSRSVIRTISSILILCFPIGIMGADKILIFTRTVGGREDSIPFVRTLLKNFLDGKGIIADTSENDILFTDAALATYKAVVFLKTSGPILNAAEHTAFEKYFRAGGGFVGIHSALDTEYNWPFYGQILGGAWFKSLGANQRQKDTAVVEDANDISTYFLPHRWGRIDEVYNYKSNPRDVSTVHVLVTVDEKSYSNVAVAADHPVSWKNELMGGRAWITSMGHPTTNYQDSLFMNHLWGGIQYAMGRSATSIGSTPERQLPNSPKAGTILVLGPDDLSVFPGNPNQNPNLNDLLGRNLESKNLPTGVKILSHSR
jgi:type 1 glutamine amidotransferase